MYNESIIISKIEYSKLFGEFFMNRFYKEIQAANAGYFNRIEYFFKYPLLKL